MILYIPRCVLIVGKEKCCTRYLLRSQHHPVPTRLTIEVIPQIWINGKKKNAHPTTMTSRVLSVHGNENSGLKHLMYSKYLLYFHLLSLCTVSLLPRPSLETLKAADCNSRGKYFSSSLKEYTRKETRL